MKILVINGSPKGNNSITLQTALYLEKKFPENEWDYMNVGQQITRLERQPVMFLDHVADAKLLLFVYPVYTFLVPSQLYRFIDLMKESGIDLHEKYAAQISTSKHFYDVTAHAFMKENLQDMGMRYLGGLSADMEDLLHEKGQKEAVSFWKHLVWQMKKGIYEPFPDKRTQPAIIQTTTLQEKEKKLPGRIVIVTDLPAAGIKTCDHAAAAEDSALKNMIQRLQNRLPYESEICNLRDFRFGGGCLGCLHCVISGHCVYRDGFEDFLRTRIQGGDAIVYAFTIRNHAMGALFKMYDDRQFVNGHRTVTMGRPIGYLVHGSLSSEENLRMMLEARAQTGGNYLAGIASDEKGPDVEIDRLAAELTYAIRHHYRQPANFYGVGGGKIFRDLVYEMRGFMKADHQFYKEHHLYDDLPNRKLGLTVAMYAAGALMQNPKIQRAASSKMSEGMLAPYRKVIERA